MVRRNQIPNTNATKAQRSQNTSGNSLTPYAHVPKLTIPAWSSHAAGDAPHPDYWPLAPILAT